jgi:hypothetical protein
MSHIAMKMLGIQKDFLKTKTAGFRPPFVASYRS